MCLCTYCAVVLFIRNNHKMCLKSNLILLVFPPVRPQCSFMGMVISHDMLLGRWRLSLELFGRVFMEDVGAEPGSVCMSPWEDSSSYNSIVNLFWVWVTFFSFFHLKILTELGGFEVKESKFRREMEKLRNQQSRDLTLEVKCSLGF